MEVEEELVRPRTLDTIEYVKDRIEQIAELLEVVDNSALKPGEVTSGPRTVFQRLPRHMRRRAMSHNIKRLPRATRALAAKYEMKSLHRKKPPSRKWRRRPTRLLKKLQRLRRRNVWLETHIWHAKRFRMTEIWGWKLPLRSFQRGFRPTYRDAVHATVVFDLSYLCCTQISQRGNSADVDAIVKVLAGMCVGTVSPTFAFLAARRDGTECNVFLYKPGAYPCGFLGPARFSWAFDTMTNIWTLQIWSHPASHSAILKAILDQTSAKLVATLTRRTELISTQNSVQDTRLTDSPEKSRATERLSKCLRKIKEKQLRQQFLSEREQIRQMPNVYTSDDFQVVDLRHELVRIRLVGLGSVSLLARALHLVNDDDLDSIKLRKEFLDSHAYWRSIACTGTIQAGNLRDGTTISLLVEDPRIARTKTARHTLNLMKSTDITSQTPPKPPTHVFWNDEFRRGQLQKRLTNAELDKARAENTFSGLRSTPFKIPILLIVRHCQAVGSNPGISQNQIDLITPSETGMDFWLALQFANGRAAGLADKIHLDFESGVLNYPADCADSAAAKEYAAINASALKAKHLKRPHNRRLKYEGRLCVKYPFTFEWPELIADCCRPADNGITSTKLDDANVFVLRDKAVLLKLNDWFIGKKVRNYDSAKQEIDIIFNKYSNALVALRCTQTRRGRVKRLALICLPTNEDLKLLRSDPIAAIEEPNPRPKRKLPQSDDEELNELPTNVKTAKLDEFMSIEGETSFNGKLVKLSELFPDENDLKMKKNNEKKAKRKAVVKERKLNQKQAASLAQYENSTDSDCQMAEPVKLVSTTSYRGECSRSVVGRVVRGDYSFVKSSGVSFGYCPLSVLPLLRRNKKVLLRNTSSKFYHQANVSLMMSSSTL